MLLPRCGKYRIQESLDRRPNSKVFLGESQVRMMDLQTPFGGALTAGFSIGVHEESGRVTAVKLVKILRKFQPCISGNYKF